MNSINSPLETPLMQPDEFLALAVLDGLLPAGVEVRDNALGGSYPLPDFDLGKPRVHAFFDECFPVHSVLITDYRLSVKNYFSGKPFLDTNTLYPMRKTKDNKPRTDFGARLFAARKYAGLTQAALAKAAGLKSQGSLNELEWDAYGSSFSTSLAVACGVDPIWLATGEGRMINLGMVAAKSPAPVTAPLDLINQGLDLLAITGTPRKLILDGIKEAAEQARLTIEFSKVRSPTLTDSKTPSKLETGRMNPEFGNSPTITKVRSASRDTKAKGKSRKTD